MLLRSHSFACCVMRRMNCDIDSPLSCLSWVKSHLLLRIGYSCMNMVSIISMHETISSGALSGLYTGVFSSTAPTISVAMEASTHTSRFACCSCAGDVSIFDALKKCLNDLIHVVLSIGVKSLFSSLGLRSFLTLLLLFPALQGVSSLLFAPPAAARHA